MIDLESTLRIAIRTIRINKMRSILTSLGIIIGVSSVIIMLAIGMGAQRSMAENMAKMGSNLLMVVSGSTTSGGIRMGAGSKQTLTYSDALDIQKNVLQFLLLLRIYPVQNRLSSAIKTGRQEFREQLQM